MIIMKVGGVASKVWRRKTKKVIAQQWIKPEKEVFLINREVNKELCAFSVRKTRRRLIRGD